MKSRLKKVNYGKILESDSLDFKNIFFKYGVDEKKYITFKFDKTTLENIFIYKVNKSFCIKIIRDEKHPGVFTVEGTPLGSNKKHFPLSTVGYNTHNKIGLKDIFDGWVKNIANEIEKYEALFEIKQNESWEIVKDKIKKYDSTHESLYASLGKFVVDFESILANARNVIHSLIQIDVGYYGSYYSEILVADSSASSIADYFASSMNQHFDILKDKKENNLITLVVPQEQLEFILKASNILAACIKTSGALRNNIVHATWGISIQNSTINSIVGIKQNLANKYKPIKMDFTESNFIVYCEAFNYISFCIEKLEIFLINAHYAGEPKFKLEDLKEDIDLAKLDKFKSTLKTSV